jgi:uncharacterized BrkB/YihY/UPF0761 family membrane protein
MQHASGLKARIAKSLFVGLVAVILAVILSLVYLVVRMALFAVPRAGGTVGIDPVSTVRSQPWTWIVGLAAFCLGFSWEYRRVRSR